VTGLELRVPPPLVALVLAIPMWLVTFIVPSLAWPLAVRVGVAAALAIVGVASAVSGVATFHRAGTTVDPRRPAEASALVDGGVYRVTRNPMYLGVLLVLLAFGAWLANVASLLIALAFVPYMNRFQIAPEERALASRFGSTYDAYRGRVRRWL
jgi:protein-S-isoprenylcysteine O-methyltransferase Ste14